MKIKLLIVVILSTAIFCVTSTALAMTDTERQALIVQIQQQIAQLTQQLNQMLTEQQGTDTWCHTFYADLDIGGTGSEVAALQTALQKEGFSISSNELNNQVFGISTGQAVKDFKAKHNSQIVTSGTTKVAEKTRGILNQLYGCGLTTVCAQDAMQCPDGSYVSRIPPNCNFAACPTTTCTPDNQSCVLASSIKVVSPNGGETWEVEETYTIKWESVEVDNVSIILKNFSPVYAYTVTNSTSASAGSYTWTVPDNVFVGGKYKISIQSKEKKEIIDLSDSYFSVISSNPYTPQCIYTSDCGYGKKCENQLCVDLTEVCHSDSECQYGKCVNGTCGVCTVAADCNSKEMWCISGACIRKSCSTDADCDPGRVCLQSNRTCIPSTGNNCKYDGEQCVALTNNNAKQSCEAYCNKSGKINLYSGNYSTQFGSCASTSVSSGVCCICKTLLKCESVLPLSECAKDDGKGKSPETLCNDYCQTKYGTSQLSYVALSSSNSSGLNLGSEKCSLAGVAGTDVCCRCNKAIPTEKNCLGNGEKRTTANSSLPCCPGLTYNSSLKTCNPTSCTASGQKPTNSRPCCAGLYPVITGSSVVGGDALVVNTVCGNANPGVNCTAEGQKTNPYIYGKLPCCTGLIYTGEPNNINVSGTCEKAVAGVNCVGVDQLKEYKKVCCPGLLYKDSHSETSPVGVGYCLTPRCTAGEGNACSGSSGSSSFLENIQNQLASVLDAVVEILKGLVSN